MDHKITRIGMGSFASVSMLAGRPVAFKHVHSAEHRADIKNEFEMLQALQDLRDSKSLFDVPRAFTFYDPEEPDNVIDAAGSYPQISTSSFRRMNFETAAYAMDYVVPIPPETAARIRTLFYRPNVPNALKPTLCQLYFGKVIADREQSRAPIQFFNSANFPLDVSRYQRLVACAMEDDCRYSAVDTIAYEMGELLGRLHWDAGYDGRDIEFVMGGDFFSDVKMTVIDFNQMRPWNRTMDEIPQLVDAFFANDPYYPRPISADALYEEFKSGYERVRHLQESETGIDPMRLAEAQQAGP